MKIKIGDEVLFNGSFGVNEVVSIKGSMCTTYEPCTGETYRKRLSSLSLYTPRTAYWDEQETAHAQATYRAGDTAFTVLSSDGDGGRYVFAEDGTIHKQ